MTTVQLINGAELKLQVAVDELTKAIETALKNDGFVELNGEDGRLVVLNPHHVLYIREGSPDPVMHAADNGSGLPAAATQ